MSSSAVFDPNAFSSQVWLRPCLSCCYTGAFECVCTTACTVR
jgi:hypothetical protein